MNQKNHRVLGWVIRIGLLTLLGGGLLYGFQRVERLRSEVLSLSSDSEKQAQQAASFEEAARSLERNQASLARIQGQVISRDEITTIINALETEARGRGITIEFSDVAEKQATDAKGNVVAATGPVRDIVISLTANGPPNELIAFLQSIEHLPFFALVDTWDFKTTELSPRIQTDPEALQESPKPVGRLSADVIVVVEF